MILTKPVTPSALYDALVQLPMVRTQARAAPPVAQDPDDSDGERAVRRLAGARLLLVEDNAVNQLVAREFRARRRARQRRR